MDERGLHENDVFVYFMMVFRMLKVNHCRQPHTNTLCAKLLKCSAVAHSKPHGKNCIRCSHTVFRVCMCLYVSVFDKYCVCPCMGNVMDPKLPSPYSYMHVHKKMRSITRTHSHEYTDIICILGYPLHNELYKYYL